MFYRSGRLDTPIPDRLLLDPGAVPLAGVPFRLPHGSRPVSPARRRQLNAAPYHAQVQVQPGPGFSVCRALGANPNHSSWRTPLTGTSCFMLDPGHCQPDNPHFAVPAFLNFNA